MSKDKLNKNMDKPLDKKVIDINQRMNKDRKLNKIKDKGDDDMVLDERYCTIEESIKESMNEIELYKKGEIELRSVDEGMEQWRQWAKEVEDE